MLNAPLFGEGYPSAGGEIPKPFVSAAYPKDGLLRFFSGKKGSPGGRLGHRDGKFRGAGGQKEEGGQGGDGAKKTADHCAAGASSCWSVSIFFSSASWSLSSLFISRERR